MPGMPRRLPRRLVGEVLALATLAMPTAVAVAPGAEAEAGWEVGKAVPIPVVGASARFEAPTPRPGSRALLIVSSLAREPGPFAVRVSARAADAAHDPGPVSDGTRPNPGPPATVPEAPEGPEPGVPPHERTFHMMVRDGDAASAGNYRPVLGKLRALGRRVQVYVDPADLEQVGPEALREIVATFDDRIFPATTRAIGRARDVDGDGRFTILMTGRLARLGDGRRAVDGYVRAADLDPLLASPFGNRCDMMYLNAAMGPGPHLRTVMAHEYAHAVVASLKEFAGPGGARSGTEEEGWLDEAIAHLAEDLLGDSRSNLDYRISAFLSDPSRYRLVVGDYFAADLFRSHGHRGGTYLFLRWCADRYGPELIGRLARSGRRGIGAIEEATGSTFASLFRRWSIALADRAPGASGEGYRSLDPFGTVGDRVLAGPRMNSLCVGDAISWDAAGTSAHYTIIEGLAQGGGAVAVEVSGPPEAQLQVTAILLPDDLPRLEIDARSRVGADGKPAARVKLAGRDGMPVRLDRLAWEPPIPEADPRTGVAPHGSLDRGGIASAFGACELVAGARLETEPFPIGGPGPLLFKVVGTDAKGRRVAAWGELIRAEASTSAVASSPLRSTRSAMSMGPKASPVSPISRRPAESSRPSAPIADRSQ